MLCAALKARPKGFLLIIILLAAGSVLWKIAFGNKYDLKYGLLRY